MKPRWLLLTVSVICLFCLAPASALSQGPTVVPGCGTATIDGTLSPGEWDNATRLAWPEEESGSGNVSPSQATLSGWLYVMNDVNYLYLGTNASLDSISFDQDRWYSAFRLRFTDEGNPRDNRWDADDCGPPLPGEGDLVSYEQHYPDQIFRGVYFGAFSEAGNCQSVPTTGVRSDTAPDGLVWEMRVNLNTSELDKIGPGECFRFLSILRLEGCELGSGCGGQEANWIDERVSWPEGSWPTGSPQTMGTLCLNPCEEEFVPEPGTILLMGSGLASLAGYVALRRRAS